MSLETHTSVTPASASASAGETGGAGREAQTIATLRAGDVGRRGVRVHAQGAALDPLWRPLSGAGAGRPGRAASRRGLSATPTCWPGASSAASLVRVKGRAELFRDELQISLQEIARVEVSERGSGSLLAVSKRDLDELEGFYEQLAREVYDPGLAALLERLLADEELRAGSAPRALFAARRRRGARVGAGARLLPPCFLGRLCSSTAWRWPRWRSSSAPCTLAWIATCLLCAALCTTWARRASTPMARRSLAPKRASCWATSSWDCV